MNSKYITTLPPDMQPIAAIFAALGDEIRQRILLLFQEGEELSIKDIASQFNLGRSTVVHHLAVLEKANILVVRRAGKLALYCARPDVVLAALESLREYIEEEYPVTTRENRRNKP